jgi:hypothetical protein
MQRSWLGKPSLSQYKEARPVDPFHCLRRRHDQIGERTGRVRNVCVRHQRSGCHYRGRELFSRGRYLHLEELHRCLQIADLG